MPLYTEDYLRNVAATNVYSLNESIKNARSVQLTSFDIFLSHSFLDREIVKGLYKELQNKGFSVYVDWIVDPYLDRNNVTKETAEIVRGRLKSSKTLLVAFSTNATQSKWMPWELGFIDGKTGKCALVPVSNNSTQESFIGREFLSLYPFVKRYPSTAIENEVWVVKDAYTYTTFSSWKAGSEPMRRNVNIY
jgi:hypothetical protein